MSKIWLLLKKEIVDAIRDTRTFVVCVIMPFVLYPILFAAMGLFIMSEKNKEVQLIYKIGIINQHAMPDLLTRMKTTVGFEIIEGAESISLFKKDRVDAVLLLPV